MWWFIVTILGTNVFEYDVDFKMLCFAVDVTTVITW